MPTDELRHAAARSDLKALIRGSWAELTLAPLVLITALIYQGGIFFWLGVSLLCLHGWLIARSIAPAPSAAIPIDPLAVAVGTLWAWCAATVLWSVAPLTSVHNALALAVLPLGLVVYALAVRGAPGRRAFLFGGLLVVALGLAMMSFNEARLGVAYPRSLFLNKNTHAGFLNLVILPAAAAFTLARGRIVTAALGISLALLSFSAGLPASRGALLALVGGAVVLVWASWGSDRRGRLLAAMSIVAIAYGAAGLSSGLGPRLAALPEAMSGVGGGRWYIWEGALRLLAEAPWYGQGIGTFYLSYQAFRHPLDASAGSNAHNDYLQLLIEAGMPGLLLMLALVVAVAWLGRRILSDPRLALGERVEAAALLGALVAVCVHSLVSFNFYQPSLLLVMALYLGRLQELDRGGSRPRPLTRPWRLGTVVTAGTMALLIGGLTLSSAVTVLAYESRDRGDLERAMALISGLASWLPFDDRIPYLEASLALEGQKLGEPIGDLSASQAYGRILKELGRAEQINPLRATIPALRARARLELGPPGDAPAALGDFELALVLQPSFFQARLGFARALIAQGRIEEAHWLLVEGLKFAYPPYEGLADYYRFTELLCTELGDHSNAERARSGLARYQRLLTELHEQRGHWGLARP